MLLLAVSLCLAVDSARTAVRRSAMLARDSLQLAVFVVQWFAVGLVIERSLVRLPAGALSSQLGQLSLPSLRGR